MPELPEVETVKETLKKQILNKKIIDVQVYYNNIIAYPKVEEFINNLKEQTIIDIKRRGKWLMFELNDYYLLSHLRMEGKFYIKTNEPLSKHQHVVFKFEDEELRYQDTRKFGKMYLYKKDEVYNNKPLNELGYEPFDDNLNVKYLKEKAPKIDLALFPVDRRMGKDYMKGAKQFIEQIKTTIFVPMHFSEDYEGGNALRDFAENAGCRFVSITHRGESFEITK